MKKTVMVLSLALCASLAFAQTQNFAGNRTVKKVLKNEKANQVMKPAVEPTDYKASIFSKDDFTQVQLWDFSNDQQFTTGVIGANVMIGGDFAIQHQQTGTASRWNRIAGVDDATLATYDFQSAYAAWWGYFGGRSGNFGRYVRHYMDTSYCSSTTGWMLMEMMEAGTTPNQACDAYIAFDAINLTGYGLVDIRMFQLYTKFNNDKCYVDYSTDNGATWNFTEINKKNIDVAVNDDIYGISGYTLPSTLGGQAAVKLRIRWACNDPAGGIYGYMWMLDDVRIMAAPPTHRMRSGDQYWVEGAYQQMPKGLDLPVYWRTNITNNGSFIEGNVTATIHHFTTPGSETTVDSYNMGSLAPNTDAMLMVDGLGRWPADTMSAENQEWRDGLWEYSGHVVRGQGHGFPTVNNGDNYVYATVSSDDLDYTLDTVWYNVNEDAEGNNLWGHDNGILVNKKHFTWGFNEDAEYVTDESEHFMEPGYSVWVGYSTGNAVPEGWVIRGIRLVPTSSIGYFSGTTNEIMPQLYFTDADSGYYHRLETGIESITINANEQGNDSADVIAAGYMGPYNGMQEYNSIDIMFFEQNPLEAGLQYYVGYTNINGIFSVASAAGNVYYTVDSTGTDIESHRFNAEAATEKYGTSFNSNTGIANGWSLLVRDPLGAYPSSMYPGGKYAPQYPMIYAIVGPAQQFDKYAIQFTCDDNVAIIASDEETVLCGLTDSIVEGATKYYYIVPEDGFNAVITVDGTPVASDDPNLEYNEEGNYYIYYFRNADGNHTLAATSQVSVNSVADRVKMNLQPNPANEQVNLTIEGVSGMVNCTLVDMSGRVVYSSNIYAESAQIINLSNLAKGAYFVRITNNEFSKVEKLIVR